MPIHHTKTNLRKPLRILKSVGDYLLPKQRWARRLTLGFVSLVALAGIGMVGLTQWYAYSERHTPTQLGVSFIPAYASYLGLDPQQTMDALLDINVRQFRLVSYWDEIEPTPHQYDFSGLDWQFKKAEERGATVSLAVGLRQPRWPECHTPSWANNLPPDLWKPRLNNYMAAVVNRYKDSPALASYQLENEYFNKFGQCTDFDRQRLVDEYQLVKDLDPQHPIIVSKSNNGPTLATGDPRPDQVGVSIYRRVWDGQTTKRYFTYPMPPSYYGAGAALQKIITGKPSVIHELQMEPWPPNGKSILEISVAEQKKSMNADMFKGRVDFAKRTGVKSIDLWGAEWWYWLKETKQDPSVWNEAQKTFANN